jgi:hypothetical protein
LCSPSGCEISNNCATGVRLPLHLTVAEYRLDEKLRRLAIISGEEVGLVAKTNVRVAKAILARPLQLLVIDAEHRESAIGEEVANLVKQHMRRLGARETGTASIYLTSHSTMSSLVRPEYSGGEWLERVNHGAGKRGLWSVRYLSA